MSLRVSRRALFVRAQPVSETRFPHCNYVIELNQVVNQ